ncbi:3-hydroxyisobutyrate dehydrogenase [Prescottella subtropica]|uniref:3-hydroxyisobutyrate dehydrogenase n=1 Tax=Prescottella subtropica TaxID=2545757 RepID=UPI0010F65834|nr:3-hydroxyisobutyrate dehydrogenase [Prescottella subtropica]
MAAADPQLGTGRKGTSMKVGWIGLGNMGLPMAANLHSAGRTAGFTVVGFDLSPDAREAASAQGVPTAESVADAATGADVLFTMLPKGEHVRSVLLDAGALAVAAPGALVVDCSTIGTADAVALSTAVTGAGRRFLDAPVSGGTAGAQNATLTFMVGGADADLGAVCPLLDAMGARIFHAGDTGAGQSAKMLNNMMLAMNMQSTCEAAVLAERLGVAPKTVIDIAGVSTGDSWALRQYYPVGGAVESAPSSRDFTGGFAVTLMRKDLGLALDAATAHGVDAAATAEVARRLDVLADSGFGGLDFSALIRLVDGTVGGDAR